MSSAKVILQASNFLTQMGIPFTSIKMFGRMLMINTTDYQSARVIESILNGSGIEKVGIEEPDDRYNDEYTIAGLIEEELNKHLNSGEEDEDEV